MARQIKSKPISATTELELLFEQRGMRWTPQRQLVLATLQEHSGHVSAEEIHAEIIKTFPRINLATVYRTLETLCEIGVLAVVEPTKTDICRRFELVEPHQHYHLSCENCGSQLELDTSLVQAWQNQILERYNFKLAFSHFVGNGRCANCLALQK